MALSDLPLKDSQKEIVSRLISATAEGDMRPFIYPWLHDAPRSAATLNPYRGSNHFMLNFVMMLRQVSGPPLFMGPKEIERRGGKIKDGARPYHVVFAGRTSPKKDKEPGSEQPELPSADAPTPEPTAGKEAPPVLDPIAQPSEVKKSRVFIVEHKVYHLTDTEGVKLPAKTQEYVDRWNTRRLSWNSPENHTKLRSMLENSDICPVVYGGDTACYLKGADKVLMPSKDLFCSEIDELTTLAHELAHASGGPRHLQRPSLVGFHPMGSPEYAVEECVAVVASLQMCQSAGVTPSDEQIENWARYLRGYKFPELLRGSPQRFMRCLTEAEFAADYIENPDKRPDFVKRRSEKLRQNEFAFSEFNTDATSVVNPGPSEKLMEFARKQKEQDSVISR